MKTIEIMRPDPIVECDGQRIEITDSMWAVFRLLVLFGGKTVTKADIASLKETMEDQVGSKVRYLRDQLSGAGCESLIDTARGLGYRAVLEGWQVDALNFRKTVEEFKAWDLASIDLPIDAETADAGIKKLEEALAKWSSNP